MGVIVQKYGGTSMANTERVKNVARIAMETQKKGNDVVVVVSAPAGMTDNLIKMAKDITSNPHAREMDMLLATGEQTSIALLAMAIQEAGGKAISFTGSQIGIVTDTSHTKAKIQSIDSDKIKNELSQGKVVIVAGFQGRTENMDITTLGRGGSDTTGVAIGVALSADAIEIYTDVDAIYTADPRIVPTAKKIPFISYEEMLELAGAGSKVLHIRSVELAAKYGLKIHSRSSFVPDEGTIVKEADETMEKAVVRGIAHSKNEAKITIVGVPDKPGIAATIFGRVASNNVNVDIIIQNLGMDGKNDISFTMPSSDLATALKVCEELKTELGAKDVVSDETIGKVSIVGVGMRSNPGVAASMFGALAEAGVNIEMIATSEIKIAVVIDKDKVDEAVRVLHTKFELDKEVN